MGVVMNNDDFVTRREFQSQHDAHAREHEESRKAIDTALASVDKLALIHSDAHNREHLAHQREHELHSEFHETEHMMTQRALEKSDATLERRLEDMNQFRDQLERQAGTFVSRATFDAWVKERSEKLDTAIANITDKYDGVLNAIVNRHDGDMQAMREQLQSEREIRKSFEGSMNTWKWIASFLGASGVGGVILLFVTRFTQ